MSYNFEEGKDKIIDEVINKISPQSIHGKSEICAEFIRQFYNTVALDDLREWSIDDLYGAVL